VIETFKKLIFWTAIAFIILTIISLTIVQTLPFEFADYKDQHRFYDILIQGFPVATLLTLFGTVKKENTKRRNWIIGGLTTFVSILTFAGQILLVYMFGFGAWTTESILYRHKIEKREIKEQVFDVGAFGYGGRRIVEIKPFLTYWILPTEIDTLTIDKTKWNLVNEEGDIKFP
jgi:hypothetical protein